MTCKNIRTGKLWMTPEIQAVNQLKWANEVPGRVQKSYVYLNKHKCAHTHKCKSMCVCDCGSVGVCVHVCVCACLCLHHTYTCT